MSNLNSPSKTFIGATETTFCPLGSSRPAIMNYLHFTKWNILNTYYKEYAVQVLVHLQTINICMTLYFGKFNTI